MTEKDELVEVVARELNCAALSQSPATRKRLAQKAIASIRPTIVEEVLRELRWYKVRVGPTKFKMFGQHGNEMLEAYAKEHGLDLTQDDKGDHNE